MNRRSFVAMTGACALAGGVVAHVSTSSFGTLRQVVAGVLDVGYYESGDERDPPVLLLHGWPYVIALLDALNIERAVLAGYDWGGRAACVAAARNSPTWDFDADTFERSATSFDNPDHVAVVIHSYRHRLGQAKGYPRYAELESRLARQPPIRVPAITLDGETDGVVRSTDGSADAPRFLGEREHRVVPCAGHNLPQEAPHAFADAVLQLARARSPR